MPNFRKKINRLAPMIISAAMLMSLTAAAYGFEDEEQEYDPSDYTDYWEDTTTSDSLFDTETSDTSESEPSDTSDTETSDTPDTEPPDTSDTSDTTPEDTETDPPVTLPLTMSMSFAERWLTVGEGTQLTARVLNTDEYYPVSFYSSNANVAMVDTSGYIMAVGAGTAVITARSSNIEGYAYIYVSEPPVVPEFIVLTENSFTLKIDQTAQIQARLLPEEAAEGYDISYTSNDPSIASVDENGIITAISEGETTITVEGAGLQETVYISVSSDIAYDVARLDGYLYDGSGKPIMGTHLMVDNLTAITDKDGYFVFDSVEQRALTIRLADDKDAVCGLSVSGDTTVYLLYDSGALTRLGSYEELAGHLAINSVKFDAANIVLTAGEVYELTYRYEPSDAMVTGINYSSSNSVAAVVGQMDGIVTAKSPGETTITISLNNGQALATCTITVNPRESSEHSALIVAIEAVVMAAGAAVVLISYRNYKRKSLDSIEEDEDLHDID